jgi:hypothetical protein
MEIRGRVRNGVVVLEDGHSLPEGTIVTVSYTSPEPTTTLTPKSAHRVQFPLVPSESPGSIDLTAERISELLEDDDLAAYGGAE